MSTERRTPGVHSQPRPLGPNGERLCYNCRGPLPKGRAYNCSSACSEKWRIRTSPGAMRAAVFERDRGVCALCHTDTVALQAEYQTLPRRSFLDTSEDPRSAFLELHGVPPGRASTDWWDADHVVPVIEGGGECGLTNYRTLCIPCHAAVTRELAARLAQDRARQRERERAANSPQYALF